MNLNFLLAALLAPVILLGAYKAGGYFESKPLATALKEQRDLAETRKNRIAELERVSGDKGDGVDKLKEELPKTLVKYVDRYINLPAEQQAGCSWNAAKADTIAQIIREANNQARGVQDKTVVEEK